jgi:shikimate dehydrogenase
MKYYGLIGFPLSHSFSEKYFAEKFEREGIADCVYSNFPIEHIGLLPRLIAENENLYGLNITIPYKEQVIPFLDSIDDEIADLRAVNTIKIYRKSGATRLKGFNTDVYGFSASLKPVLKEHYRNALILGSGGASKAAAHVLSDLGFTITCVSRTPKSQNQISYKQLTPQIISISKVIVNASPVGMYPNINSCPDIPYEYLTNDHVLFDLIYNPAETKFLSMGKRMGATIINGLNMLHFQAEKAWKIWNTEQL